MPSPLPPPVDPFVTLSVRPGTVVTSPLDVTGEAYAPEGVLRVTLYVVRDGRLIEVASYAPSVPLGDVPFTLRWDPAGVAPGRVTLRVVGSSALRGFSAEATDLLVPPPPAAARRDGGPRPAGIDALPDMPPSPHGSGGPVADDSGRAFGPSAPTLPYPPPVEPLPSRPVTRIAATPRPEADPNGWRSVAAGLLLLVTCGHAHRALRADPRSPA